MKLFIDILRTLQMPQKYKNFIEKKKKKEIPSGFEPGTRAPKARVPIHYAIRPLKPLG